MNRFIARPFLTLGARSVPAFRACGYLGLLSGLGAGLVLCACRDLSAWMVMALAFAAVGTFFALAWGMKLVTGTERLVYYHHQIAILAVCAVLLRAAGKPELAYLDVTAVGLGVFLACGRIGCLLAGCCHGRMCGWGVRYGRPQRRTGFPSLYVGLRLLPVQAFEALWALGVSFCCFIAILNRSAAGDAFSLYLIGYGVGRFYLETLRGDPQRPRLWGVTEAQWTALCLAVAVSWADWRGWLTPHVWHYAASGLLAASAAVLALDYLIRPGRRLFDAWHTWEIAGAVERATGSSQSTVASETSKGLRISGNSLADRRQDVRIVAFSRPGAKLGQNDAAALAKLIGNLCGCRYPNNGWELLNSQSGVFYVVMRVAARSASLPRFLQSRGKRPADSVERQTS